MKRPARPGTWLRAACLLSVAFVLATPSLVAARTLTSQDGRAIEVEILGFEGLEKVRFKRTDTGQTFTTPITAFSSADQEALLEEAKAEAAKPRELHPGDLVLEMGRGRFDTRKTAEDAEMRGGGTIRGAIITTEEDWGYSLTLRNSTRHPVEGLRAEYILFVEVDVLKYTGKKPGLRRQSGKLNFDPLPPAGRLTLKTDSVTTREVKLKDGVTWRGTSDRSTRDTLVGIWVRIYRGDELVLENASPPKLATTHEWRTDD